MRQSDINISILLDEQNTPEVIKWSATDKPGEETEETRAFSLSVWDHATKSIMKLDLWTKDMEVPDMKNFYIQMLGSMAEMLMASTNDEEMSAEIESLTKRLAQLFREQEKEK